MKFNDFIEHIKYGECYNLALGAALRQGDAGEQEVAVRQCTAYIRQGLTELSERFDIFVGSEGIYVPADYPQIRIQDPEYLRFIELSAEGRVLAPFHIQNTDSWDFKVVAHGRFALHERWAGKTVLVTYKKAPVSSFTDDTEIPLPYINALAAYVAHRASGTVGSLRPEELSVFFARYRDSVEALEDAGYGHLRDMPAKNIKTGGFI